ncbi:MAG: PL29 family lyase N-terminal domain-containing protein [Fermentimonas sp.]
MKRFFTTIVLAAMIILAGCTDLDDVQRQLDELKDRLKSAEQLANNVNSEIASIRGLIDAMNEKVSMVSYKELADKSGYELTLSDGGKITLKHGAKGDDGITPEINVKQHSDGLLYWTINGNFLLDSNGNKVVAQGFTPQLRVNSEFHWEMSLDGGTTWQLVKDNEGKPVPAQGPKGDDGDVDLTITETDDVIIIVYKGVTYTLQKSGGVTPPSVYSITFTTTKKLIKGQKIKLTIDAAPADRADVWIDLNNNDIKDNGEEVTTFNSPVQYPLRGKTVTIYGKVTLLDCSANSLSELDVTNNSALKELTCRDNKLAELDLSKNAILTELICGNNDLEELDVTNNAALTELWCNKNELITLDLSKNTALKTLWCQGNQFTTLDLSKNNALMELKCFSNKISGDNMTALVNSLPNRTAGSKGKFYVFGSGLTEQNECTRQQVVIATSKHWEVMNYNGNPYKGSGDYMILTTTKNVGDEIKLTINAASADAADVWIDLNNNGIKESGETVTPSDVDAYYTLGAQTITIYGKVMWLVCSNNDLKVLDVANNAALDLLDCSNNDLTALDVSNNTTLEFLWCHKNQLQTLNVNNNEALRNLYCYNNKISGDNMTALVNSLHNRTGNSEGIFRVIDLLNPEEQNVCTTAQVGIATSKNWIVRDADDNPYPGSGMLPPP